MIRVDHDGLGGAGRQLVTTGKNTAVAISLTGNDVDGDALSYAIETGPANDALAGSDSVWVYTPNTDFTGADSLTFVIGDGAGGADSAMVSITVKKGKGGNGGGGGGKDKPPRGKP